jgi:hypothetical protein
VDDDGEADVADLLEIVLYLRSGGPTFLSGVPTAPPYVDVNGDRLATVADLVAAIAAIRNQIVAAGEAVSEATRPTLASTSQPDDDFREDVAIRGLDDQLLDCLQSIHETMARKR